MSITRQNWLNAQATRRYPLDDNATGTGDDGIRLKDDVLLDMHLRWPISAGQYAFLSGITVTNTIVTAVFLACDENFTVTSFVPLAAVTIIQPVTRHRFYNVEPLFPGVGGFVSFGDIEEEFAIRFATPQQGLLAPRVGRPYSPLPIPSLGKKGRVDPLTGLITIIAGSDIEIVKEEVDFEGGKEDAMVIRLARPTIVGDDILSQYIGPCGKRPESKNCDRVGIETINGVSPNCDGNIELDFPGMTLGPYASCGSDDAGVTLEQDTGLDQVCTPKTDPDRFKGNDLCSSSSSITAPSESVVSSSLSSESESSSSSSSVSDSSSSNSCPGLPFYDCFDESPIDADWSLKLGAFVFAKVDSPEEAPCYTAGSCEAIDEGFSSFSSSASLSSSSLLSSDSILLSSLSCPVFSSSSSGGLMTDLPSPEESSSSLSSSSNCAYKTYWAFNNGVWKTEEYVIQVTYGVPWIESSSSSCLLQKDFALQLSDLSRRNILVWENTGGCDSPYSYDILVRTHVMLTNRSSNQNAGIVMNYHTVDPILNPHIEYWTAQIDRNSNRVELLRFNGTVLVLENFVTPSTPFSLTDWYEIAGKAEDFGGGQTLIHIQVRNVTTPAWPVVSFNFLTSNWKEPDGFFGIHTTRAAANFSFWELSNA